MALRGAVLRRAAHFFFASMREATPGATLRAQLRFGPGSSLIPQRMKNWLRVILNRWQLWSKPPRPTADRSRLVGMYLSQANHPFDSGRASGTRERQEGKVSQNRRRG